VKGGQQQQRFERAHDGRATRARECAARRGAARSARRTTPGRVGMASEAEVQATTEELERFAARGGETGPRLRRVLEELRAVGAPTYEWELLRPLLGAALTGSLAAFRAANPGTDPAPLAAQGGFEAGLARLLAALEGFQGAPFTLQRLVELILEPDQYYRSVAKLIFGLEKLLSVSSVLEVVDPASVVLPRPAIRAADASGSVAALDAAGARRGIVGAAGDADDELMGDGDEDQPLQAKGSSTSVVVEQDHDPDSARLTQMSGPLAGL
jgi:hypothetical protein